MHHCQIYCIHCVSQYNTCTHKLMTNRQKLLSKPDIKHFQFLGLGGPCYIRCAQYFANGWERWIKTVLYSAKGWHDANKTLPVFACVKKLSALFCKYVQPRICIIFWLLQPCNKVRMDQWYTVTTVLLHYRHNYRCQKADRC